MRRPGLLRLLFRLVTGFVLLSFGWVLLYRFVNPPLTATMAADLAAGRGANRQWLSLDRIDRDVVRAVIAAEDGKYCRHHGFDTQAIEAAMRANAGGGRLRGGSTISQQTAKNAFLWQGGGYPRKALEAWFTLLIEQVWGKRRIMEVYLNLAETGIGTYGVDSGARRYFGHGADAMTAAEAAALAAVLPLPKRREAVTPRGFTARYGRTIARRIATVRRDGLDACVYAGAAPPVERRSVAPARTPRTRPGEDYEVRRATPAPSPDPSPAGADAVSPPPAAPVEPKPASPAPDGPPPSTAEPPTV